MPSAKFYAAHKEEYRKYNMAHRKYQTEFLKQWRKENPERFGVLNRRHVRLHKTGLRTDIILNNWFFGSQLHHINRNTGCYIPAKLHLSIPHSVLKNRRMEAINAVALGWVLSHV